MSERAAKRYIPFGETVAKFRPYHPILARVRYLIKKSERWTVNEVRTGQTITIAFSVQLPEVSDETA